MDPDKRKRLAAAGWVETTLQEFLDLTDEEVRLIDLRIHVSREAKAAREKAGLTQAEVARRIGSSQPRVAVAERAGRGASLDLLFRCLFASGGTFGPNLEPRATTKKSPVRKRTKQPVAGRH